MKMNVTILLGHANFDYQCKLFESLWQGHRHVITNYFSQPWLLFRIVVIWEISVYISSKSLQFHGRTNQENVNSNSSRFL